MPKINFIDYINNYEDIKNEDKRKFKKLKRQKKLETKKHKYELNAATEQECLELKKYLEVLKNSINSNSIDREEVKDSIAKKIVCIDDLKTELLLKNKNVYIFENLRDNLSNIYNKFGIILVITLVLSTIMGLLMSPIINMILSLIVLIVLDFRVFEREGPCIEKIFKIAIGSLPFNNRYSFIKVIRKLEKLEKEYKKFQNQYEDYLSYLQNPEKSEVAENIIKTKEVKDLYLLEINKLVDKVKELPLGEDREKYLIVLEKLTELYKREKERIILKNGRVHSEEEIELGMSVLKQLAYIEMQINSSIYKNKNVNLLSEDYLTTLGKLDNAKGKKLERTLGLGK